MSANPEYIAAMDKVVLNAKQLRAVEQAGDRFRGLSVCVLNCTLKASPEVSNTDALIKLAKLMYEAAGASVDVIRAVDHNIATGVYPDMTQKNPHWKVDEWPQLYSRIMQADIIILASPVWLGMKSSVCTTVIERLYANSHLTNAAGQYSAYGKVGGCLVTGNEDGGKHVAIEIIYAMQHLGFLVTPQADVAFLGTNVGPGPSLLDNVDSFLQNDFVMRNTTFLVFNSMIAAKMVKDAGGWPNVGNSYGDWKVGGCHADNPNPEHRK